MERTKTAEGKASATRVDLHAKDDGSCRITIKTKPAKISDRQGFAEAKPITIEELQKLLE